MSSRRPPLPTQEPARSRWARRAKTIPMMLAITALALAVAPLVVPAVAVADLVRGRRRLPTLRVYLFLLQYAVNDSVEILLAPVYWLLAGCGTRLGSPASVRRHDRLQQWSIRLLARRAEQLLGLRIEIDDGSMAALAPGPVVVLCRHVNLVDASLPSLLCLRLGMRTRGVIMAELLADPGFDLIYARTGSVFIPRDNGPEALAMVATLAPHVDDRTAAVIFPEGRLFRPDRLERALTRLTDGNPERAARLAALRHVLPPRPGGTLALLHTLPAADVVVIAHAGLEEYASFAALARAVPLQTPLVVTVWRIPAADVPAGLDERAVWLDEQWLRVDGWVAAQLADGPAARLVDHPNQG